MNYYRLNQTDIDGKSKYSKILGLYIEMGETTVKLFPNPAENTIELKGINIEKDLIEILNNLGQNVGEKVVIKNQVINIGELPQGKYFIKAPKKRDG